MESWKRTLSLIIFAQVISSIGFAVFFPFLPSYINQLGSTTGVSLEFWTAVVFGGQALTMAITAPFWGSIADRSGRKPMLLRALFGGSVIILLMGFARSAEDLVLLRVIQGAVTGTIAAANALVAASVPREKVGAAMSYMQVGLWGGVALGPLIGGAIADTLGFRAVFVLTAVLLLISGVMISFGVKEEFVPPAPGASRPSFLVSWGSILRTPHVAAAYTVRFLNWVGTSMLLPFLPLFILTLSVGQRQVNTFTGLVVGISSATGTVGALVLGPLGDRVGHRRVLIGTTLVAALVSFPHAVVTEGWQLLVLQGLQGAALGAMGPALIALLARYTKVGDSGAVFGLDSSITAGARAIAPLLGAGTVLWLGMRGLFIVLGISLLIAALLAALTLPERPVAKEPEGEGQLEAVVGD
jgi:DHA1 family multidrug resistance protein-like MFS transporter